MDTRMLLKREIDFADTECLITLVSIEILRLWSVLDYWGGHTCETRAACESAVETANRYLQSPETALVQRLVNNPKYLEEQVSILPAEDAAKKMMEAMLIGVLFFNKLVLVIDANTEESLLPNWLRQLEAYLNEQDLCAFQVILRISYSIDNSELFLQQTRIDLQTLCTILPNVRQGAQIIQIIKENTLNELSDGLKKEGWRLEYARQEELDRHALLLEEQAASLNQTLDQIRESVQDVGPVYNKINRFGYICPGVMEEYASLGNGLSRIEYAKTRFGKLVDVCGEVAKDSSQILICAEDIEVCLALAWGGEAPIIPSFSLEPVGGDDNREAGWRFDEKKFDPAWIGNTGLGKTFFFTDYLMKQIAMANAYVSFLDPTYARPHNGKYSHSIPSWIDTEIANVSFEKDDDPYLDQGLGGRLCWKLAAVEVSKYKGCYIVGNAEMYVEGSSYRRLANGNFERDYRIDDPRTDSGATAQAFSENLQRLAEAFPAIDRQRELFKLIYLFSKMRNDGVKLSFPMKRKLQAIKKRISMCGEGTLQYVPKAYHRCGCKCSGGTDPRGASLKPVSTARLEAAQLGTKYHSFEAKLVREAENNGFTPESGFRCIGVNETMGGTKRPDYVYVNDDRKIIVVEDTYTGTKFEVGHESVSHHLKGWRYMHEPRIREYIDSGYDFHYVSGNPRGTVH